VSPGAARALDAPSKVDEENDDKAKADETAATTDDSKVARIAMGRGKTLADTARDRLRVLSPE